MRPSAAQLLQHERIETIHKVAEAVKMYVSPGNQRSASKSSVPRFEVVKGHRSAIANREREVAIREQAVQEKEQRLAAIFIQKDQEIATLQRMVEQLQQIPHISQQEVELAVRQAVVCREHELRSLVTKREEEVGKAIAQREEEIMEAVRRRETEFSEAWVNREEDIRKEVEQNCKVMDEKMEWITKREVELKDEEERLEDMRAELEERIKKWEQKNATKGIIHL